MKKEQVLARLDEKWNEFKASYAGLSEEQINAPGVTEMWTVKDVIAHVNSWDEEAIKYLPVVLQGKRLPRYSIMYGGIDAFNAKTTTERKHFSLTEVLEQFESTHQKLLDYLQTIPENEFTTETKFRHRLRLDTYSHYPLHAKMIQEWREKVHV